MLIYIYPPFFLYFEFAQCVSANAFLFRGKVLMWGIGGGMTNNGFAWSHLGIQELWWEPAF